MKIEHIAMYVNDLEQARQFFEKYFGGRSNDLYCSKKTDFRSYFISFEDGARLEIMTKPGLEDEEKKAGQNRVYPPGVQRGKQRGSGSADREAERRRLPGSKRPQNHRRRIL